MSFDRIFCAFRFQALAKNVQEGLKFRRGGVFLENSTKGQGIYFLRALKRNFGGLDDRFKF